MSCCSTSSAAWTTKRPWQLSSASRHFHTLTEPYLYSTFVQVGLAGEAMPLFLRTLMEEPLLGVHVKTWIGSSCNDLAIEMNLMGEDNLDLLDDLIYFLIQEIGAYYDKWCHAANIGSWDAVADILICILPNLEEINFINYGSPEGYPFLEAVLARACEPRRREFPKDWTESTPDFGITCPQVRDDLLWTLDEKDRYRFRCGRSSSACIGLISNGPYKIPSAQDSKFKLSNLAIAHSAVNSDSFRDFLSCFAAVRHVKYNFDYDYKFEAEQPYPQHVDFTPSSLRDAIGHLSGSLEELSITQENYREPQLPILDRGMLPLTDFKKLKRLESSALVLLRTNTRIRQPDNPFKES